MRSTDHTFVELGGERNYQTVFINGVNFGHQIYVVGDDRVAVTELVHRVLAEVELQAKAIGITFEVRKGNRRPCGCGGG